MPYSAWTHAASYFGGSFERDPNLAVQGTLNITVDGIPIVGHAATPTTTLSAATPGPRGLHLHVLDRARYGRMSLGTHEFPGLPLGTFRVDANDRDYAALWLTESLCHMLCSVGSSHYEFEMRDEYATAIAPAFHERRPDVLVAAIHALAAFARRSTEIGSAWQRLATAVGGRTVAQSWRPTGKTSAVIPYCGETVRLDVFTGDQAGTDVSGLHTRVRCARRTAAPLDFFAICSAKLPDISLHLPAVLRPISIAGLPRYVGSCSAYAPMTPRFTSARCKYLQDLSPYLVVGGPRDVHIYLRGFVASPARIRAAARLCVELAVEVDAAARGPYR